VLVVIMAFMVVVAFVARDRGLGVFLAIVFPPADRAQPQARQALSSVLYPQHGQRKRACTTVSTKE
jgi:hypothetical protein